MYLHICISPSPTRLPSCAFGRAVASAALALARTHRRVPSLLRSLTAARECGPLLQIELQARRARGERLSPAEDQLLLENCVQPLQVSGRALGTA
jgi:hypothetical protein